ncbi:insulinase family protein [Chitinimonas arctica]|uniref:Insulinase family protein n=1 Tax=Chitinimonas arctica TaxID=2594795 RepID=A0A516SK74_9NEIS|nr:pitrilysin family protein [Chitinimonas arctica]QDQ28418.1 insulinase family protein [Chitinimonas arctica]
MKRLLLSSLLGLIGTVYAADFRLPAYETSKLPNGLTIQLMERHEVPLIAVRAVVKAGSVWDGKQAGLANLTAEALLLGSQRYGKKALEEAFDFRGANIGSVSGAEQAILTADFARDDTAALLPILAEVLQHPSFDAGELNKLRARSVDGLKQAKESPRNVVQSYYRSMLFGEGAYGNPAEGTVGSVGALKRADVQAFHQRYYRPDNATLVVVGDFKAAELRQQLEKLFGNWQAKGEAPKELAYGTVRADKARVWLINKPDSVETTFMFGGAGIARNDPDYIPLQVVNTILGGRFTSWLNDELRVNSGLTYGARSEFSSLSQTGTFLVSSFTALDKTEAALALASKTYQRLWDKGIDEATLESAKAYVKGQYPPRFETNEQLAGLLGDMFAYRLERAQLDSFMQSVDQLTTASAKQLVEKHFPRDKLQMVLIGKAETIRPIAAKYGEVTELDIKADGFAPLVR